MKVVFVDDSKIVLQTLESLVREMVEEKKISCDFFNDSSQVKQMIEEEILEYDLMFVDINMPLVSGFDLTKAAKKLKKYQYKPIIAVTSEFTETSKKQGKEAGIDGWFTKSITQDSLHISIVDAIQTLYKS